jgi:hypothetical protein
MSESKEYVSPSSNAPVAELGDASATTDSHEPLKICLILTKGVVVWLDSIANQKGCQLNRSSVARAMITAFSKRGIRFTGARTESDIVEMVGRALDIALNSRAQAKPAAPAPRPPQANGTASMPRPPQVKVDVVNGKAAVAVAPTPRANGGLEDDERLKAEANRIFDEYLLQKGAASSSKERQHERV